MSSCLTPGLGTKLTQFVISYSNEGTRARLDEFSFCVATCYTSALKGAIHNGGSTTAKPILKCRDSTVDENSNESVPTVSSTLIRMG